MQSVEAEDLFEIHSYRLLLVPFAYSCRVVDIYSIPVLLVSSNSSRHGFIFPSSRPFTYSYMLHVSVAFRIWLLGFSKGVNVT